MTLEECISERVKETEFQRFWDELLQVIENCKDHLKRIEMCMPTYDIHDERHSQKVAENIWALIERNADQLSLYELMLLYAAAYMHDAGMALPAWEYELLRATEGDEERYDNTVIPHMRNDGKPPMDLADIKAFIEANKQEYYPDFREVERFVFAPQDERRLQEELAKRVQDYQAFRNKHIKALEPDPDDEGQYYKASDSLRAEFIRETHHIRSAELVMTLRSRFSETLGGGLSIQFANDLASVCKAHCEDFNDVLKLEGHSMLGELGVASLPFASILVRLGDIIHYDAARAPLSLRSERGIALNRESFPHWENKAQEVSSDIVNAEEKTTVSFSAFCDNPDLFYRLHGYIDLVDREIGNYYTFLNRLFSQEEKDRYGLPLSSGVDRSGIRVDESVFEPDLDAKFTMDQSKILDLLTGTSLYSDKYLCIRELYQNAMDACKCMRAELEAKGEATESYIEFGMEKNEKGETCLYCLDNGTGMSRHIIKEYFLNIGNSYYTSGEFAGSNIAWGGKVHPISQFGIGALACFMLGPRLEVVTKHYENPSEALAFTVDNAKGRFFYTPVNSFDAEKVGDHGTLVRVILDDDATSELNNELPSDFMRLIYIVSRMDPSERPSDEVDRFAHSLFYKVNSQIAFPAEGMRVCVRAEDGHTQDIVPYSTLFGVGEDWFEGSWLSGKDILRDHFPYSSELIANIWENRSELSVADVAMRVDGVDAITYVSLPGPGLEFCDTNAFELDSFLWDTGDIEVFVDGIVVKKSKSDTEIRYERVFGPLYQNGSQLLLNFTGAMRPRLSVDRNSIVEWPDSLKGLMERVVEEIPQAIASIVAGHLKENGIGPQSPLAEIAIESILKAFPTFAGATLRYLSETPYGTIPMIDYKGSNDVVLPLGEAITGDAIAVSDFDTRDIDQWSKDVLLGKLAGASVVRIQGRNMTADASVFFPVSDVLIRRDELIFSEMIIKADQWEGEFSEYDVVAQFWPLVSPQLFDAISLHYEEHRPVDEVTSRVKLIDRSGNGLFELSKLKSILIHPEYGVSTDRNMLMWGEELNIGDFGDHVRHFYFFDLMGSREEPDVLKSIVLYAFVPPSQLTERQLRDLEAYDGDEDYKRGAQEGWSILFIGGKPVVLLPGVRPRQELVEIAKADPDILDSGIVYKDLKGEVVLSPAT